MGKGEKRAGGNKKRKKKRERREKQVHRDKRNTVYLKVETKRRRNAISLMESQIHKSAIQPFSFLCVLRSFQQTFQSGSTCTSGLDRYRTRLCKVTNRGGEVGKLKLFRPAVVLSKMLSISRTRNLPFFCLPSPRAKCTRNHNTLLLVKDLDIFFHFPKKYDRNRVRNVEAPGLSLLLCFFLESRDSRRDPSIIFSRVTSMFLLLGKQTHSAVSVRAHSSAKVLISESNLSTVKARRLGFPVV